MSNQAGVNWIQMRSETEMEFWQDVFKTALANPQFTAYLLRLSKDNHCLLLDYLATFADDSVKALRYRSLEREAAPFFEFSLLSGVPK